MERKNRYRNPVRLATVLRVAFLCLLGGIGGAGFVYLRNDHVKTGDQIRQAEKEIEDLKEETQLWELRVAGAMDRIELSRRLEWMGSDLQSIDPARVIKIPVPAAPPGQ